MTRMFESQLGKSIEVYINDMVVKSKVVSERVTDLGSIFEILRKHKLHLNASKCSFGVGSGKFLRYMVTHRGIEVNPDQIKSINSLRPPRNPKEVQKLIGMAATLNRFISRSADRCKPFFLLMKRWKGFEWTEECALAFQQLKEYLSRPPIMSSPKVDEILFADIVMAPYTVSLVLLRVDNGIQQPIYYLPLKAILRSADYTGRIAKWSMILGAFDTKYMPRTFVKGQVLANLVDEFAEPSLEEVTEAQHMDGKSVGMISQQGPLSWKVYVDGAANQKESGVGIVLISPKKITIEKSLRLGFSTTNNKFEYKALLMGMTRVLKMGRKAIEMFSDSRLVIGQVKGEFEAKDKRMQKYLSQVRHLWSRFESFNLLHVPRSGNTHADSLATLATSSAQGLPQVIFVEDLYKPAGVEKGMIHVHQVRVGPSWMDPIISFLKDDILLEEKSEIVKMRRKVPQFWLFKDQKLYRRSFSGPYLLCIHPEAT
ncbi:uncharacterized protein LOC126722153 [Quercus robur]|uniref:uncharacterized protein LOC126722153 n=1 Tax=Quercus robur TaxID=38942 RepID=UPI00216300DD|nr:uncharacterized protein LOC126722153 [Quercus robur]